jgi:hypothetical protein
MEVPESELLTEVQFPVVQVWLCTYLFI